ncbi:MAG: lysylphosphatidylglycerol synthase transmembrane domain-containing protein, partial [Acidobacteriota bacterium]
MTDGLTPPPRAPAARRQQARWLRLLRLGLAAAVLSLTGFFLWRTLGQDGFRRLPEHLRHADPWWLAGAAAVNLARYGVWTARWRGILYPVRRAPWALCFGALMSSVFLNTVLPGARPLGGIVRARILTRRTGEGTGPVYAATLIDQVGYSLVSVAIGLLFLPGALLPAQQGHGRWLVAGVAAGGLGLVAAAFLFPGVRRWGRQRLGDRLVGAARAVEGAVAAVPGVLGRPATWVWIVSAGPAVWMASAVTIWLAGHALGAEFTLATAAAAWALGS